jgi:hypothetical protein
MLEAQVTPTRLAAAVNVDVKSVHRWIREGRVPYPATRRLVAQALRQEETYLWPELVIDDAGTTGASSCWPSRTAIPSGTWHELFEHATERIEILVYAGEFLFEALDVITAIRFKLARGVAVRMLVGDPNSAAVQSRAAELQRPWLPERCGTTLSDLSSLVGDGLVLRSHRSTLYASQFRFDTTVLANVHAYGLPAAQSPVLKVEGANDPLFHFYVAAFDRIWAGGSAVRALRPRKWAPVAEGRYRGPACRAGSS